MRVIKHITTIVFYIFLPFPKIQGCKPQPLQLDRSLDLCYHREPPYEAQFYYAQSMRNGPLIKLPMFHLPV